jgi:hypothetical protein
LGHTGAEEAAGAEAAKRQCHVVACNPRGASAARSSVRFGATVGSDDDRGGGRVRAAAPAVLSNDEMAWERLQPLLEAVDCGACAALLWGLYNSCLVLPPAHSSRRALGSAAQAKYDSRVTERVCGRLLHPYPHATAPRTLSVSPSSRISGATQMWLWARCELCACPRADGGWSGRVLWGELRRSDHLAWPRQAAAPCGHRCDVPCVRELICPALDGGTQTWNGV